MVKISPSILSADFSKLGEEIKAIDQAGADLIHFDVMDYHYVPNLTFGPMIIKSLRKFSNKIFDVHLMIDNPELHINDFCEAGADIITFHYEAVIHHDSLISNIKNKGLKVGIALNPSTSPYVLEYIIDKIDLILIMTVNPGFGGQSFIESQLKKIEFLKDMIKGYNVEIEVDGGVNEDNAKILINKGADILVAGNYIFKDSDKYKQKINLLKSKSLST